MKFSEMFKASVVVTPLLIAGIATADIQDKTTMDSNKKKVSELLDSFYTGDLAPIACINAENYVQHNLDVGEGLA